jgi:hypothetical protein
MFNRLLATSATTVAAFALLAAGGAAHAENVPVSAGAGLHSYAATYTDSEDVATVDSSTEATIVDISPVGEPTPPPVVEEPAPTCILFLCL